MQKQSKNVDSYPVEIRNVAGKSPQKEKGTVLNHPLDKKGESVNPSTYVVQHCCCGNSEGNRIRYPKRTIDDCKISGVERISEIKTGKIRAFIKIRKLAKQKK